MLVALWNPIKQEKKGYNYNCRKHLLAEPSRIHYWKLSGTWDVFESQENITGSKSAGIKPGQWLMHFFVVVVSSGHILCSKLFSDIHFTQSLTAYHCLRSVTYKVGLIKPRGRFIGILCSIKQGSKKKSIWDRSNLYFIMSVPLWFLSCFFVRKMIKTISFERV